MGKYNLNIQSDEIDEITLNKHGDKIFVSGDDANLWDRFCQGFKKVEDMAYEVDKKLSETAEKYPDVEGEVNSQGIVESIRIRTVFCEDANTVIDEIFGNGTAGKIFRDHYEMIPDFMPDDDKFIEFFMGMIPIMEDIFDRKMERSREASKQRMAKYQPQDHKRPQRKGASK